MSESAAVAREVRLIVNASIDSFGEAAFIELPHGEHEPSSFSIVRDDGSVYVVMVAMERGPRSMPMPMSPREEPLSKSGPTFEEKVDSLPATFEAQSERIVERAKRITAENAVKVMGSVEKTLALIKEQEDLLLKLRYQALRALYPNFDWGRFQNLPDAHRRSPVDTAFACYKRAQR